MSSVSKFYYTLDSCDVGSWSDGNTYATTAFASPLSGLIVYKNATSPITGFVEQAQTYLVNPLVGNPTGQVLNLPTTLVASNLASCADANIDKMYKLLLCGYEKITRDVLFLAAQNINDVIHFDGECSCWRVAFKMSTYTEVAPAIAATHTDCETCLATIASEVCTYGERSRSFAVRIKPLAIEPVDRGFSECCYSNRVFADLAEPNNVYHNDFTSVFYQKQSPNDTVTFEIIGVSTGTTALVDGTHGTLYDFDPLHPNPNLSYFRVSWHDILAAVGLGEDVYTIRMNISIAGLPATAKDTNSFDLKAWSIARANGTARIDCAMDGTLEAINVNFKGSDYDTSLRIKGYFGNPQDEYEQFNVVHQSKKGYKNYTNQITMNNDPSFTFQANNIPECISRELREFIAFGNDLYISDYNLNNHSYRYEVKPVVLDGVDSNDYPVEGRGVNISMTFKDRNKTNRKTNC